jgi:glycosyltransferase involved in cell wall biosynthesis
MRVAINAQLLSFSDNYRNGGISRYIRSLLTELARRTAEQDEQDGPAGRLAQPGRHDYTVFVNGQAVLERLKQELPESQRVTYVAAAWPERSPIARVTWEQLSLPALLRERHIDVFHSPANVLPEMLPRGCAGVVTLHDLAFLRFPHVLSRAKRIYHRTFTTRSLKRAALIIASSESTRRDAVELVGIPAERIQTVHLCIDPRFSSVITDEEITSFRRRSGLEGGYFLYLGTLEPRKNIPALLEAYARLRAKHQRLEKLALVGGKGWLYDEIFERVRALGLASDVLFPGFVSDAEQLLWYHGASAFVYPSLYEGFGLPVSEALACGIPVVTTNVSSLPEAGAGLALTVAPGDIDGLAEAMLQALTDTPLRRRCRSEAHAIAAQFSAKRMVEQTIDVYERAAHRSERKQEVSLAR